MGGDQHEDAYDGAVTLVVGDRTVAATAVLRGHFEPIDGRFHWYGRIGADAAGLESGATVTLSTPHGSADGRLSDVDPWGRLRVAGVGRPPY